MQAIITKIVKTIDSPAWRHWWLGWYAGIVSAIVVIAWIVTRNGGF